MLDKKFWLLVASLVIAGLIIYWLLRPVMEKPVIMSKKQAKKQVVAKKQPQLLKKQLPLKEPAAIKFNFLPSAKLRQVKTVTENGVRLTTAIFEVKASLYALESNLIESLSRQWTLIRESATNGIGFNLIFKQLAEEKTLALFAVKKSLSLNEEAASLIRVTVIYGERAK